MTIPGSTNPLLAYKAAGTTQYQVSRSLRFNSADSAYLSRTPASLGNRKTWTWSGWVKRSGFGTLQTLFGVDNGIGDNYFVLAFQTDDSLYASNYSAFYRRTSQVFRDPSAWYHILVAVDTTAATASDRLKMYVNGAQISSFQSSSDPAQNTDLGINAAVVHNIGRVPTPSRYFDGYLAEIHFIDGQALTPSSFGQTDANGEWQPIAYTGSYPGNSFKLNFSNNASTTTISQDSSGNNNHWTANNISVTAGAGNDSLVDTPTSYGTDTGVGAEVLGNYCTLNPLSKQTFFGVNGGTLSDGNLNLANLSGSYYLPANIAVSSGKWYFENTILTASTYNTRTGFITTKDVVSGSDPTVNVSIYESGSANPSTITLNGSTVQTGLTNYTTAVVGVALNLDSLTCQFYVNGSAYGSQVTGLTAGLYTAFVYGGGTSIVNFGQRPFAYTAPSGFKALCDTNLPEGTITTSGTFTGNANADGPFVWLNGVPTAMTINGNAVTFGTHADKLANGFKLRSSSTSYNTAGSNTYSITTTGAKFKYARAQANP